MMQNEIKIENDVIHLRGNLDFNNAMSIYKTSLNAFSTAQIKIVFDFSELQSANSAALGLIINWMKLARKNNKAIQFKNLSEDIMSLAKASGLDKLITPLIV